MMLRNRKRAFWFLLSFSALLTAVLGTLVTQAQQKAAVSDERARLTELRSTVILDTAPVAMVMSDARGIITYHNPQAEKLFGWEHGEMLGKPVHPLLFGETAKRHEARFTEAVARIKEHEGAWQFTRRVSGDALTKSGEKIHVHVTVRGIKYNGYLEFVAVIVPTKHKEGVEAHPFVPRQHNGKVPAPYTQHSER